MKRKTSGREQVNRPAELLVGLGLGLGFLTSLRFAGPVGVPEILVALGFLFLVWRRPRGVFHSRSRLERALKIYLIFSVGFILPVVTLLIHFDGSYANGSNPQYILSFILGIGLAFWLQEAIAANAIDMKRLTLWFAIAFVLANFVAVFVFNYDVGISDEGRYAGGAKNPNQLTFYAATLSLLLVVFSPRLALFVIPVIVFIVLRAKSDAYGFGMVVVIASYVFFRLLFSFRLSFGLKIGLSVCAVVVGAVLALTVFSETLAQIWVVADEGNTRVDLMRNGFLATLRSPLVGLGAGSFSGVFYPFAGSEAHNTFLDFSMQFGLVFPLVIYGVMIGALIELLRRRRFLVAAFVVGFIESGMFHFSGRHFTFWVELAVFMNYLFMRGPSFDRRRRLAV